MIAKTTDRLISIVYTRLLVRVLDLPKRNLYQLLKGTGLRESILFNTEETFITIKQQMVILENARNISGRDDIGLRLASQLHPSIHGPLGFLVTSSPDLKSAITAFADFLPIRIPFSQVTIEYDDQWMKSICTFNTELDVNVQKMLQECFAFIIQAIVESVLGRKFIEGIIHLRHPEPDYSASYQRHIHSPVSFAQTDNAFLIPINLIDTINVSGNPEFHYHSQRQCQQLLDRLPVNEKSTTEQVQHILLSNPIGSLTEEQIAQRLCVSKRTLSRRLKDENTSYRGVLDNILAELSTNHLKDNNLSIEAIAHILGYNDASAFRKAFRRWYSVSPSDFRKNKVG